MLSNIEHSEILRTLPPAQRLRYSLSLILCVAGAFLVTLILAIGLALLFVRLFNPEPLRIEEVTIIAIPVVIALLLALGITRNPSREGVPPGQTVVSLARAAARRGFINGIVTGVIMGIVWSLIFQVDAIYFGVWGVQFNTNAILFRAAMLPIAIAPALALFRAITSVIDDILLRQVAHAK